MTPKGCRPRGRSTSLRRAVGTKQPRATIRVYVEGEATEPEYVMALRDLAHVQDSVALRLEIRERGKSPSYLVDVACSDMRRSDLDVDSYWCIFDVEAPVKHVDMRLYIERVDEAISRAQRLRRMHEGNGTVFPADNPSSSMDLFVEAVRAAASRARASGE